MFPSNSIDGVKIKKVVSEDFPLTINRNTRSEIVTSSCFSLIDICLLSELIFFRRIVFLSFSFLSTDFSSLSALPESSANNISLKLLCD